MVVWCFGFGCSCGWAGFVSWLFLFACNLRNADSAVVWFGFGDLCGVEVCWLNCLLGLLLSVGFVVDLVDFLAGFVF